MYCLDTNIIIFALRGNNKQLAERIQNGLRKNILCTTAITAMELLYYSYKHSSKASLQLRTEFLQLLPILSIDFSTAKRCAELKADLEKQGQKLDEFDLMIASAALENEVILVTNNTKHFSRIDGLILEDWLN